MRQFLIFLFAFSAQNVFAEPSSLPVFDQNSLQDYENLIMSQGYYRDQYKRVHQFTCADLASLSLEYQNAMKTLFDVAPAEGEVNIIEKKVSRFIGHRRKPSNLRFPYLTQEAKNSLQTKLPLSWEALKAKAKEIDPDNFELLLAIFMREGEGDPFLDENVGDYFSLNTEVNEKASKKGAGLIQMTARGFDDYRRYEDFVKSGAPRPADVPAFASKRAKNQIKTEKDFLETPYNPALSLWFGKNEIIGPKESVLTKWGINLNALGSANRAAILGATYNTGCAPMRCAVERVKLWNKYSGQSPLDINEWANMRKFLYMIEEEALAARFPPELVSKLKNVCEGVPEEDSCEGHSACKCLDGGLGFGKASVVASYGDHMVKIVNCINNENFVGPPTPEPKDKAIDWVKHKKKQQPPPQN